MTHPLRVPCSLCGATDGRIESRNGQDCVFCSSCDRWQYNAPRTETGKATRSTTTIHNGVKPSQRARVLMRDGNACSICHVSDKPLHVGHLLAVETGLSMGLTDTEINSDENLAAMCEECNLGLSNRPLPLRLVVAILRSCTRGLARGR